jgi:peptidoglycan hydrolase-like protein with peptidoglycan-binding domain
VVVDPDAAYPYYGDSANYGSDDAAAAPAVNNAAPVSVQIQQALARQGYYQGPIDGIVGHGTQAAIAAYQRDNGLRVTGTINGGLLDALDLD